MKKNFSSQSGQATTEMVFMLLAFVIVLLGLIFTLSLEIFNTRVLLDSKFRTERASSAANARHNGSGQDIRGWEYANGIPFTLKDEAVHRGTGEMAQSHFDLGISSDSDGKNYAYEWVKLQGFPHGKFTADYRERDNSARAAADLVTQKGDAQGRMLTKGLPELYTALGSLLGLRINDDNLRNNPSNRVYLPANGDL
jgi:hypothetical protein